METIFNSYFKSTNVIVEPVNNGHPCHGQRSIYGCNREVAASKIMYGVLLADLSGCNKEVHGRHTHAVTTVHRFNCILTKHATWQYCNVQLTNWCCTWEYCYESCVPGKVNGQTRKELDQ